MTTAVDTNALLALLYDDDYADASERALRNAHRKGRTVITPIVYAELAADGHFETASDLDRFLEEFSIQLVDPSGNALFRAGQAFQRYTDRGPDGLQCPSCGAKQQSTCRVCATNLAPRQHIAADFLIGGHASTEADVLVTFDTGFYRTYFPGLSVAPE
ncbi:type II toxin-antitoxin system VapC family toxin [Natrinema caseinilyticum]|uniref:type II toxin-antitoxin system VapC family toxin n=1 Tax=Natrinema caseinilyticum TaxID=2961570 RepID=UPI0020C36A45|nr:type II toxin-antitoxin system VapC family toxin [Natrinema caseinilyticum]